MTASASITPLLPPWPSKGARSSALLFPLSPRDTCLPPEGEPLYEEIQAAYDRHFRSHYTSRQRIPRRTPEEFAQPAELLNSYGFEGLETRGFTDVSQRFYDAERTYAADEYILYLDTMADHRGLPGDNKTALYAAIKEAIIKHGGCLREHLVFQLYIGRKL